MWLCAVQGPSGFEFGTKGATIAQALHSRYYNVLFARAARLDDRSAGLFYTWRRYLEPLWQEETGAALWRPARSGGRVGRWDSLRLLAPPPPLAPHPRSERQPAAGPAPWRWIGGAGPGTTIPPASPPPPSNPDPDPSATWLEVAAEVHTLLPRVTDAWWVTLPRPGMVWATASWPDVLSRVSPATAGTSSTRRPPRPIALPRAGSTIVPPGPSPCVAAHQRQWPATPPLRSACRAWAGDLCLLDPVAGAAGPYGPRSAADLQACTAAPDLFLYPLFNDRQRVEDSPPPPRAPG